MISFKDPLFLILLVIPPVIWYFIKRRRLPGTIVYSDTSLVKSGGSTWKVQGLEALPIVMTIALILAIIGLARPQIGLKGSLIRREGVDIVMVLDVSTSMLAEDFKIKGTQTNRLEVVKSVTRDFIERRPNDRIGIVVFSGRPYILSPITWDHHWCISRLDEVKAGMIEDGTAIGSALAAGVNRLRESTAKSKVIVLLTDGVNNAGQIAPEAAAEAARAMGAIVYTVGAGSKGFAPYPAFDQFGRKVYQSMKVDLDEALLKKIAATARGRYFRATDTQSLTNIFQQIDRLAKTMMEAPRYREHLDLYPYFLLAALILLLAETIFANTVLRRLP